MNNKLSKRRGLACYGIAAATALILALVLAVLLQIYPFGDRGLMFIDGSQYFSAAGYVQRALLGQENLLYSWGNILGGNALSLVAYYASSPFNLLLLLFPGNLLLGVHVIILLKLVTAALCFCCLLQHRAEGHTWLKGLLSGCYPFMGYAVTFIWNISWLDGIVVLPLIYLGMIRLVREQKPLLYILSLGFALFSNFYIGFMLCIASVLFYGAELILSPEGLPAAFKKSIGWFILASLLAGGLSMVICLPTLCSLPEGRTQSLTELLLHNEKTIPFDQMGVMLLSGAWGLLLDAPLIFVSIPVLVLAVLYFCNGTVPVRSRLTYGGLLGILLISFRNTLPNMLWHATTSPHDFNFRYAFLFSFLLFLLAFDELAQLKQSRPLHLLGGLLPVLLVIALRDLFVYYATPNTRLLDLLMILCTLAFCWGFCRTRLYDRLKLTRIKLPLQRVLLTAFSLMLVGNLLENSLLMLKPAAPQEESGEGYMGYFQPIDRSPSAAVGRGYLEARDAFRTDTAAIEDDGFYRMELVHKWYRCDANLFGYPGMTNFSSTENGELTRFLAAIGAVRYHDASIDYDRFVPAATDSLLGLRYLISHTPLELKQDYPVTELPTGHSLYRNPTAFSLILPAETLDSWSAEAVLPFEQLNRCYRSLVSEAAPVFTRLEASQVCEQADNGYGTDLVMTLTVPDDRPLYLSSPQELLPQLTMTVNGENRPWPLDKFHRIFYLGSFEPGTELVLTLYYNAPVSGEDIQLWQENRDSIAQVFEAVPFVEVTRHSNSHLSFSLTADRNDQPVATTIPYDRGWRVTDNGKSIPVQSNWGSCMLAFRLEDTGPHEIEMHFIPAGLWAGLTLSLISLAGTAALVLFRRKKQKF